MHEPNDMPTFMKLMYKKMCDSKCHINVKWFIAKLVVNRYSIFEPYAKYWFQPLVALAIMDEAENGGIGFHYFLRDFCYLFLQWTDFVPSNTSVDCELASKFIAQTIIYLINY